MIENFKVAGVTNYTDAFLRIACENEDYKLTNAELKEDYDVGDTVYQYDFAPSKVELVPEPDNEFDPNAVMVLVDGEKIGYIKKGNCTHVKNLLASGDAHVSIEIGGGKCKRLYEEDDRLIVEKGDVPFFAKVSIQTGKEDPKRAEPLPVDPSPAPLPVDPQDRMDPSARYAKDVKRKLKPFARVLGIILIVMSAILLVAEPVFGLLGIALGIFVLIYYK